MALSSLLSLEDDVLSSFFNPYPANVENMVSSS